MNEAYDRTIAAAGNDLAGSLRSARERFEAAWDAHESGGPEPRIEAFLRGLPDSLRDPISSVLEGIDRGRRKRRGGDPRAGGRPGSIEGEAPPPRLALGPPTRSPRPPSPPTRPERSAPPGIPTPPSRDGAVPEPTRSPARPGSALATG